MPTVRASSFVFRTIFPQEIAPRNALGTLGMICCFPREPDAGSGQAEKGEFD